MPAVPVRRKLLDELEEVYHTAKWARLEHQIQELVEDIFLSDTDINDHTSDISDDSISTCSTVSSLSSDASDVSFSPSISLSDLEAECYKDFEADFEAL